MANKAIKFENIHILFWLLKDLSWLMGFKILGVFIMIPTVIFAILIVWNSRESMLEMLPSLAVLFWIIANSFWMMVEFFAVDESLRVYAAIPFILGLAMICCYFILLFKSHYFTRQ